VSRLTVYWAEPTVVPPGAVPKLTLAHQFYWAVVGLSV
jgi:hypothetical protein